MSEVAVSVRWMAYAACRRPEARTTDFFAHRSDYFMRQEALEVCAGCPVRAKCLEYAVTNGEKYGIWGGLTEETRAKARVRRS